jgi:hypothetical protein
MTCEYCNKKAAEHTVFYRKDYNSKISAAFNFCDDCFVDYKVKVNKLIKKEHQQLHFSSELKPGVDSQYNT